jgi:hypothetical protein
MMISGRNNRVLAERAGGVPVPAVHTSFIASLSLNALITATIVV